MVCLAVTTNWWIFLGLEVVLLVVVLIGLGLAVRRDRG
jgi:type VI protein secretion system component VasF